jgi:hypothetical protein
MMQQGYAEQPTVVSTLDEAHKLVSFRLLLPRALPRGLEFVGGYYFQRPHLFSETVSLDYIMLYYEGTDQHVVIREGSLGMPSPTNYTPDDAFGPLSINGKPGMWLDGLHKGTDWVRGLLQVAWEHNSVPVTIDGNKVTLGKETAPGLPRTCMVLGRADEASCGELIAIAQSLE